MLEPKSGGFSIIEHSPKQPLTSDRRCYSVPEGEYSPGFTLFWGGTQVDIELNPEGWQYLTPEGDWKPLVDAAPEFIANILSPLEAYTLRKASARTLHEMCSGLHATLFALGKSELIRRKPCYLPAD